MRISECQIKKLQELLKSKLGLDYTDEEAQQAGLAIMRFVAAKQLRTSELEAIDESEDGKRSIE